MTTCETARPVAAQRSGSHISLLVVPRQTSEVGHHALLVPWRAAGGETRLVGGRRAIVHPGIRPGVEARAQTAVGGIEAAALRTIRLCTQHGIEGMLAQVPGVGKGIGPRNAPAVALALADSGTGVVVTVNGEMIKRLETTIVVAIVFHTEGRTEMQVLDKLEVSISIGCQRDVLRLVIVIDHHQSVRVAVSIVPRTVGGIVVRQPIKSIVTVDRCQRRSSESGTQRVVVLIADKHAAFLVIDG